MRNLAISIVFACSTLAVACGGDDSVGTTDDTSADDGSTSDTTAATTAPDTADTSAAGDSAADSDSDPGADTSDADGAATEDSPGDTTSPDIDDGGVTPIGGACADARDCGSGLCLANGTSGVCASACSAESPCAAGATCIEVTTPAGTTSICADRNDIAGLPCSDDGGCAAGAHCVAGEDGVSRCEFACDAGQCDPGYSCDGASQLCVPTGGFDCSLFDAAAGRSGDCDVTNTFGRCSGRYVCNGAGAGACSAAVPAAEVCDGIDNDCNDQTDDGLCDDDNPCTSDACDPDHLGTCKYQALTGAACDDGNDCTELDACDAAGMCAGTSICQCDTADDCVLPASLHGACVSVACSGTPKVCTFTPANAGATCTSDVACMTDGVCGADGHCIDQQTTCDDGKSCTTDVCNPDGTCSTTNKPAGTTCSDNDLCTTGDACVAGGLCIPSGTLACSDTNACTTNTCDPQSGCQVSNNRDACDDGNPCTLADTCSDGTCKGTSLDCGALDSACAIGTCTPSGCVATPRSGSCDDGDPCTSGDHCAAGSCVSDPLDCSALDTACAPATCTGGSCTAPTTSCTFTARVQSVSVALDYTPANGAHWLQCSVGHGGPIGVDDGGQPHDVIWGFHTVHLHAP